MNKDLENILKEVESIKYGWCDKYNVIHHHAKKDYFIDNYRFMSIEKTLEKNVGTCFEQTALVSSRLNELGIENKKYIIIYNDPDKIARHTICVAHMDNKYILMETSWILRDNTLVFNTLEEILLKIVKLYPKMYKIEPFKKELIEIYEYDNEVVGSTFEEFTSNARNCTHIDLSI